MILKHRDRELLRFSWNRYGDVCDLEFNRNETQFLPLGLRKRLEKPSGQKLEWILDEWIRSRTAPLSRRCLRELLSSLGFKPRTANYHRQLVELCRGLSLNDVYWLAADDSRDAWKDVNLYQNPFSTAVATMAFSGYGYLPAREIMTREEAIRDRRFASVFFFDAIVFNTDRHLGNFGFLVDNETNEIVKTAPPRERLDLALYFVQKRIAEIKEFGVKADEKLKIALKRGTITETAEKMSANLGEKIVETLSSYPKATKKGLAKLFKVSERTIARCLKDLKEANRICRVGSRKGGLWKVVS